MAKIIVRGREKKKNKYAGIIYVATIVLSILFIYFGNQIASKDMTAFNSTDKMRVEKAQITEIIEVVEQTEAVGDETSVLIEDVLYKAELLSGVDKGSVVSGVQNINSYFKVTPKEVAVGDKIVMYQMPSDQYSADWVYGEYMRTDGLIVLGIIFAILLLLFGRLKGLQTLLSMSFTVLAIFLVFIPAILSGYNVYLWTMIICLFVTIMSLTIVSGVNMKTLAASIGCIFGIAFSAVLVLITDHFLKLTGVVDEDSIYLLLMNPDHPIDLKSIFFGAIVIGCMGALLDVSMSISAALYEIKEKYAANTFSQIVSSGMTIGRDTIGTMANTLILAYIGSSLSIVLLLITYNPSMLDLLNREMVVIEIMQALIGSLGILLTVPLTSIASGLLFARGADSSRLKNRV
jgi:uncharacterized membrane protein